jgi:hypothetical protein
MGLLSPGIYYNVLTPPEARSRTGVEGYGLGLVMSAVAVGLGIVFLRRAARESDLSAKRWAEAAIGVGSAGCVVWLVVLVIGALA